MTLQLCPAGSGRHQGEVPAPLHGTPMLTLTAALLLPPISKFSLKQGSRDATGDGVRFATVRCQTGRPRGSSDLILAQPAGYFAFVYLDLRKEREIITVWSHIALSELCWCIWF